MTTERVKALRLSAAEQAKLPLLEPFWVRVAKGEVDLNQYTDDEILDVELRMPDGRVAPKPRVIPETLEREQMRRSTSVAERKIREGADAAIDVYAAILQDEYAAKADRMKAAQFFTDRRFGKDTVNVRVQQTTDPIQSLFQDILSTDGALLDEDEKDGVL